MSVAEETGPPVQDRAPPHGGCLDLRSLSCNYATSFGARIMTTEKFQLRYSPVEDRILIIVTDEDGQEEVFGLTRRLVKRLVPSVEKVLKASGHLVEPPVPDTQNPAPGPTPAESLAFEARQQSEAAAAAAAGNPGETPPPAADDKPAPLAPVTSRLVTRLRVTDRGNGVHILHMTDGRHHLDVPLTDEQLTQFSHGIVTVLGNADWDLEPIDTGESESATTATKIDITAESPSKYRH